VWTPADAAALRVLADDYPTEVGDSTVSDHLIDCEVLG
jgi:hypothetical protein